MGEVDDLDTKNIEGRAYKLLYCMQIGLNKNNSRVNMSGYLDEDEELYLDEYGEDLDIFNSVNTRLKLMEVLEKEGNPENINDVYTDLLDLLNDQEIILEKYIDSPQYKELKRYYNSNIKLVDDFEKKYKSDLFDKEDKETINVTPLQKKDSESGASRKLRKSKKTKKSKKYKSQKSKKYKYRKYK
jgi:hypothetical protein